MKILITGSTGLLGQALCRNLSKKVEWVGLSRKRVNSVFENLHVTCDLSVQAEVERVIETVRPDTVIHTQALSNVDLCEQEPELAQRMNVQTACNLVNALSATQTRLIHLSTDYVFDGRKKSPYDESDTINPISVYGRVKAEAEAAVLKFSYAVVIRPSTLFGSGRINFCDTIATCLREGRTVEAFIDQTTSPTYTDDLAETISVIADFINTNDNHSWPSRLLHVVNGGGCSRVDFAESIAQYTGGNAELIRRISMKDQARSATRPKNSVLATHQLTHFTGGNLRSWDDALRAYLKQRRWLISQN